MLSHFDSRIAPFVRQDFNNVVLTPYAFTKVFKLHDLKACSEFKHTLIPFLSTHKSTPILKIRALLWSIKP